MSKPFIAFLVFAFSVCHSAATLAAPAKPKQHTAHQREAHRSHRQKATKRHVPRKPGYKRPVHAKTPVSRIDAVAPLQRQAEPRCKAQAVSTVPLPGSAAIFAATPAPAFPLEGKGGESLQLFFARLRLLETAEGAGRVRIMQIGDSHTAGDYFSHALRTAFQRRFADGGPGWLRPGGLKNYRSAQVEYRQSPAWQIIDSRIDKLRPFSLGGFMAITEMADASLQYQFNHVSTPEPSMMELTWKGGPDAGRVDILADGNPIRQLQTGSEPSGWVHTRVALDKAPHSLKLKTLDNKPVQLAGITLEYCQKGVVLDNIGTNGAQTSILSRWDNEELRRQLIGRNPSFVILSYGTNEAFDPNFSATQLRINLQRTAQMLQHSVPQASVLLLGPPDSMRENQCGGEIQHKLSTVRHIQRQLAAENRWLYWDWSALMGGNCGIAQWAEKQLARADHVHMTPQGYALSAEALFEALMDKYQQFVNVAQTPRHLLSKALHENLKDQNL